MIEKTINIKKRFDELTDLIADPKIIAEKIMKKARSSGNDDDMTVMVLKINAA